MPPPDVAAATPAADLTPDEPLDDGFVDPYPPFLAGCQAEPGSLPPFNPHAVPRPSDPRTPLPEHAPTRWLWPAHLPAGRLVVLSGDVSAGKSRLIADLAARATAGLLWPDGAPACPPGDVILFCAEDDATDTVFPRLAAAGADENRVHVARPVVNLKGRTLATTFPRDLDQLYRMLDYARQPRLIVLDPLAAYLGPAGDFTPDVPARLAPVTHLAAQHNVTVLAVTHRDLRRRTDRKSTGMSRRALADASFLAAARAAWHLGIDPTDTQVDLRHRRRLLTPLKVASNSPPAALAFRIAGDKLAWEGPIPSASQPQTPDAPPDVRNQEFGEALAWLYEFLQSGAVAASHVFDEARQALFPQSTVRRAARTLGVRSVKNRFRGQWNWSLPPRETPYATHPENKPQDGRESSPLDFHGQ